MQMNEKGAKHSLRKTSRTTSCSGCIKFFEHFEQYLNHIVSLCKVGVLSGTSAIFDILTSFSECTCKMSLLQSDHFNFGAPVPPYSVYISYTWNVNVLRGEI